MKTQSLSKISLASDVEASLIAGARDSEPVRGLTHGFYKYPARFSPAFARAAILAFTKPGDVVLDNHVGGGTTLVEALACGRHAIGVDISTLAKFVASVKTTVFRKGELDRLESWSENIVDAINIRKQSTHLADYAELGYYKHLSHRSRWRLRKAVEQGIGAAVDLDTPRLEAFGRCAVLKATQWALDGRSKLPTFDEYREYLGETARSMVVGARALSDIVPAPRPVVKVINRSASGIEDDRRLRGGRPPRLVLTSPPYPGVHILYHRWQVDGRKEAPLPFMIANELDGAGSSYYTMGDRKNPMLASYFANIRATMSSAVKISDAQTIFVQMVAFSDPTWQLPRYLEAMEQAGLEEVFLPSLQGEGDARLWRTVPGRRWYSEQRGKTPGSQEVVLIHRKSDKLPKCGQAAAMRAQLYPSP